MFGCSVTRPGTNTDIASYSNAPLISHCMNKIHMQDPEEAIKVAVEETSTPEELTAAQISVSITIVANLTDKVLNNSEVAMICLTVNPYS